MDDGEKCVRRQSVCAGRWEGPMARIALLADIHGNGPALDAVLSDVRDVGADSVVCLGDVVGYGPDPEKCVEDVHTSCDQLVMGNHDEAVLIESTADLFNENARAAIHFCREQLSDWSMTLLKLMPYAVQVEDVSITHGSFGVDRFEYLYTAEAASFAFEGMLTRVGAVGHTHLPSVFTCPGDAQPTPDNVRVFPVNGAVRCRLPEDRRVIVNPGSVGQPRDRNPDASWALIDTSSMIFEVRRVAYDIDSVTSRILELGLPASHGHRLRVGT
ncbi:MAG: metallophosphoesterase family protein [Planctomycetota bacterium]